MSSDQTNEKKRILVTVDKSHLVTIGEKLYTEKMAFVRELVNNAYDADATEVRVEMSGSAVMITDNGSGMDEDGLRQYFTIGSSLKRTQNLSPKFGRTRIGEFGIGKFAALSACRKFEVETMTGSFHAKLLFDKESWSRHEDWHLDIEILPLNSEKKTGTTIKLHELNISLPFGRVRRCLAERTPIQASDFSVYLNNDLVTDELLPGRRLPVNIITNYGGINGFIIIAPVGRRLEQFGLAVTVKKVLVRYESLGLDSSRKWGVTRIGGRVNADWLPITSSRDDFIRDTDEFGVFANAIKKEIAKALKIIKSEGDRRANLQASRVLRDAMQKISRAMRQHHELFPESRIVLGKNTDNYDPQARPGYDISQARFLPSQDQLDPELKKRLVENDMKKVKGRPRGILGDKSVIRTLRVADMEMAVRMEHLGNEDESYISGGVIYVNLDHPLYRTYQNNDELLIQHVARILTKELALRTGVIDAQRAFSIQSELLTQAFKSIKKGR